MKEEIKSHWKKWVFLLTLGTLLIVIYKAIDSIGDLTNFVKNLLSIVSPFLAGLLMAYLLYIPESKIERTFKKARTKVLRKHARKFAIFTTYIIAILILFIIINVILPVLIESINELIGNLQNYYSKIIETYNNLPDDSIFKTEKIYSALKDLQNLDIQQYLSIDRITGYVKSVVGVATGIFDVFVSIVVSIYILAERNEILNFFKRLTKVLFKEKTYKNIETYFYKANGVFFKFISSQFLDAVIVGVLATIVMKILNIKYASLLGFSIGLFNMIPYFGAIIAISIAGLITLITAGFSKAIIMLIAIIILQQIDANIINPKIIGDSLQISPILVILSVTIGGGYFGIIGMFLGVPIAAVLKILVNDYIDNKLEV
jgi:predicted PurR-regulated permease PerM